MLNINLNTKDKVKIAINYFQNGFDEIVIVAPGWCMTKDSNAFLRISNCFSKYFDVICLDFRGHGKSSGFFTFTTKEFMDMDCVVRFARQNKYKRIYLVGFSLGAAVAILYSSKSIFIDKVIAVSPPTDFNKIENQMWKIQAWGQTLKKFELSRFLSIRPYILPTKKVRPIDVVTNIKVPTLFVSGEKDPTVHCWHTRELYKHALCPKEYKEYKNGCHAEDLFLDFEEDFSKLCLDWLKSQDFVLKN